MALQNGEPSDIQTTDETLSDIRAISIRCRELLHTLSTSNGPTDCAQARDQRASFNIWAANMGVFQQGRQSVTFRLKNAPEISQLSRQLLVTLKRDLEKELSRAEGQDESSSDNESDESSDRSSTSSYRLLQPSPGDDEASLPPQSGIWASVHSVITSLHQLRLTLHRAGNQHRQKRIERFIQLPRNEDVFKLFQSLARQSVDHLFPNASPALRERMAQSIARRRARFLYLEQHQKKISTLNEPAPVLQPKEPMETEIAQTAPPVEHQETRDVAAPIQPTSGLKIQPSVIMSATEVTKPDTKILRSAQNKRAESVSSVKISTGKFPSMPKLDPSGASFTCPFCFVIFPAEEADGRRQWMNHLIHDFEPFFCVSDSCPSPFDCANSYTGWLAHMRETHTQPRWHCWHCQPPSPISGPFSTPEELDSHLKNCHGEEVTESLRPTLVKHSMLHDQPALQDCPFCGGFPEELEEKYPDRDCSQARDALEKHVRDHLISVALILVPVEMEEESHGEYDDKESEAQRDNNSERDLDGVGEIYELECSNDICDCKDHAANSVPDWSTYEATLLPDPVYWGEADDRIEWEFWHPYSLQPDCNPIGPSEYPGLEDDVKLREYFRIETLRPETQEDSYRAETPSMRLINAETLKLEVFENGEIPPYAILSHTWGSEELFFREVENGEIDRAGIGFVKFRGCCAQAQKDGLGYVWIDTCCIDKTNEVELGEAINSMFQWYSNATVCYAYLTDVPDGDDDPSKPQSRFQTSRWFHRGWTLQELIAPRVVRFYNSDWQLIGDKRSLRTIIKDVTRVPLEFLLGTSELHVASVAQRMSWAAHRETTRAEDMAYCLLGIFGVTMPVMYSEGGEQAFFRLQEQIINTANDDSILAWDLNNETNGPPITSPEQINSGGVFASAPSQFANSGQIIMREGATSVLHRLGFVGHIGRGFIRADLPLMTNAQGEIFGMLDCSSESDATQAVAIPLARATIPGFSNEYIRPMGYHSVLLPTATFKPLPERICIRKISRIGALEYRWRYQEGPFARYNLALIEVAPRSSWDEQQNVISLGKFDNALTNTTLVRFRHNTEESQDFVIIIECKPPSSHIDPDCYLMVCDRNTSLEEIAEKLSYIMLGASLGRRASNGPVYLGITLDHISGEISITPWAPRPQQGNTFDATIELMRINLVLKSIGTDIANRERQVALIVASSRGDIDVVQRLLDTGKVDVNLQDNNGWTPLNWASEAGHQNIVQLLLDNGAGVNICCRQTLEGHINIVHSVAFSPDSRLIVSGSYDKTIKIWDTATGQCQQTLKGHSGIVWSVAFSHDSRLIVSGSGDNTIKIWESATGQCQQTLQGHEYGINTVAFSHNSRLIVSGSGDNTIKIWDSATGQCQRTPKGHSGNVWSVAFSHDSRFIASGSSDDTIKIWDSATGQCQQTLKGHSAIVWSVAFSHDSRLIVSGSGDNTIKIWESATGQCQQTLQGHEYGINTVAFSHNSRLIISGSDDNTIKIWDSATGQCQQTLRGHEHRINSVAFSHDSRFIASGSSDYTIKIWDVSVLYHLVASRSNQRNVEGNEINPSRTNEDQVSGGSSAQESGGVLPESDQVKSKRKSLFSRLTRFARSSSKD